MKKKGQSSGRATSAIQANRRQRVRRRRPYALVRNLITAPFRVDLGVSATGSGVHRDQERRAELLRLILSITILILLLLAIPLSHVRHQTSVVSVLGLVAVSAALSLVLTLQGYTQVAALLFICTNAALALGFALGQPNPLNPALVAT